MKIVSIMNYKGGVGKTTLTANIAAELAWRGKRVLLLDVDPQCSLTFSFVSPDYWSSNLEKTKTIKTWFDAILEHKSIKFDSLLTEELQANKRLKSSGGKIDLLASHLGLIDVDLQLATMLGGANMKQTERQYINVHGQLCQDLRNFAQKKHYDIVIVDCPPNFNIVTKNAIIASDGVLIPTKPDHLSTLGIQYLIENFNNLIKDFNEYSESKICPRIYGVVFTMIQIMNKKPIAAQRNYITKVSSSTYDIKCFDSWIRENKTIFSSAPEELIPVALRCYNNGTHKDIVEEIENLSTEFINEIES